MEKLQWHTEQRKVSDLIPYEKNPRFLSPSQKVSLIESLKKFSLVEIPAIDIDGTLIAGHQRVSIFIELDRGSELIDVRVPNRKLTQEEFDEYNVRSNINNGSWNMDMLAENWTKDELSEFGFDKHILKAFPTPEVLQETQDVPEVSATPIVKRGDVFQLNNHRIMCGDSTQAADVATLMGDDMATMIFTDPPYNVEISGIVGLGKVKHREFAQASGEMSEKEFISFLTTIFNNQINYSTNGSIHFVCMDWKHSYEILTAARNTYQQKGKDWYKNRCTWAKDNAGMGTFYRSKTEDVYAFKNGDAKHINTFELGQHGRYRTNLWEYAGANSFTSRPREGGKTTDIGMLKEHPTPKPPELVADAILDCSHPNDIILDLFLGSGTTVVAAEQTERQARAMELDEGYCQVSIVRWLKYMRQLEKPITFIHVNGKLTADDFLPA